MTTADRENHFLSKPVVICRFNFASNYSMCGL